MIFIKQSIRQADVERYSYVRSKRHSVGHVPNPHINENTAQKLKHGKESQLVFVICGKPTGFPTKDDITVDMYFATAKFHQKGGMSLKQFIEALDRELQIFNFFIESVMEKIRATNGVPVPQGRLALKTALRASLEVTP